MNNVQNKAEGIAQIVTGENGPVLGGILGIIFLVGIHYVTKGNYKFSAQSGENSISLQPVNLKDEVSASTQIEESVEEEND